MKVFEELLTEGAVYLVDTGHDRGGHVGLPALPAAVLEVQASLDMSKAGPVWWLKPIDDRYQNIVRFLVLPHMDGDASDLWVTLQLLANRGTWVLAGAPGPLSDMLDLTNVDRQFAEIMADMNW